MGRFLWAGFNAGAMTAVVSTDKSRFRNGRLRSLDTLLPLQFAIGFSTIGLQHAVDRGYAHGAAGSSQNAHCRQFAGYLIQADSRGMQRQNVGVTIYG